MVIQVLENGVVIYSHDTESLEKGVSPTDRDKCIEIGMALDKAAELIAGPDRDGWWGL